MSISELEKRVVFLGNRPKGIWGNIRNVLGKAFPNAFPVACEELSLLPASAGYNRSEPLDHLGCALVNAVDRATYVGAYFNGIYEDEGGAGALAILATANKVEMRHDGIGGLGQALVLASRKGRVDLIKGILQQPLSRHILDDDFRQASVEVEKKIRELDKEYESQKNEHERLKLAAGALDTELRETIHSISRYMHTNRLIRSEYVKTRVLISRDISCF
jgi:hypothetical protein